MTTANVNVNFVKEKETKMYWTWHDGYQVDRLINKIKKFDLKNVEKALDWGKDDDGREDKFEKATARDGRGDWSWTLTIIDEKTAVLNGSGCDENTVKWYNLK
ncbi:MAG: hypothetical protein IK121_06175 [Lachnospiraceae bacterium]|nr:hypothetical protein [Lachnospiraceae bacterium]MBR6003971.1 hypothetical protein [Lachnospiraceae bacterium]